MSEDTTMLTPKELSQNLCNFTGTEMWHRHGLVRDMLFTDGVHYFAESAGGGGAFWLLDIIATEVFPLLKKEPFLVIRAIVNTSDCHIFADDGNDNLVWSRYIEYTDLQEGEWKFYLTDNVLLLPSEY
jgi:hypothetical protein